MGAETKNPRDAGGLCLDPEGGGAFTRPMREWKSKGAPGRVRLLAEVFAGNQRIVVMPFGAFADQTGLFGV